MTRLSSSSVVVPLTVVALSAIAAPLLTPHHPNRQFDTTVARHLPPGSQRWELTSTSGRGVLAEKVARADGSIAFRRQGRDLVVGGGAGTGPSESPRCRFFPLGTDRLGRDCWSRILYGGRISLLVGLLATAISTLLGVTVGAVAGYSSGITDTLSMRALDALMAFPQLFVILLLRSIFDGGVAFLVLFLGLTGWMPMARIVRAEIRSLAVAEFITAAR
ncbi:MAG: ABC transporter permease, partial [Acidobacteriota bacterium]|nr:ABC transporter permease [Acidobacteriota bacterium]